MPRTTDAPLLLRACRREPTPYTPVWLMRQAGRYLPEYRAMRERVGFLELCHRPEAAAEVTVMPVERLGVDAAIVFADILLVLEPFPVDLRFERGDGPVLGQPIRGAQDVGRVQTYSVVERLGFVGETIRLSRQALPPAVALIGFAGAPFTLASYLIEGRGSRSFSRTKAFMYRMPDAWHRLLAVLASLVREYLGMQIAAGADAVQLFDSWVGCLAPDDYRRYVLPHTRAAVEGLPAPVIHFGTGTAGLLEVMAEVGTEVMGVDWRIGLDRAWATIGYETAIQGNLDPAVLLAPPAQVRRHAERILREAGARPGHIFNLGHGVLPQTPVDTVRFLVETVHELSAR